MQYKSNTDWFEWVKALMLALVFAFVVRIYFISPVIVEGPSMQPTLYNQDQMIVNKFIYKLIDPSRFDIVIFHASEQKDFIKRVIGLPGEHVAIRDNQLYINDEEVEQPFLEGTFETTLFPKLVNDFTLEELPGSYEVIPEGFILVLGDNRSNSTDSRIIGLIDIDEIVGKASIIYWPIDRLRLIHE